mgnify:CR=1 FL=1
MEQEQGFIDYIEQSIIKNWDRNALTDYKGITLQYKDVARKIAKFHIVLESAGIRPGDKIAVCGRNSAHWAVAFLATVTYGAVIVPILHEFKADNIHNIVNHSEAKLLFVGDRAWENLNEEAMPLLMGIVLLTDFTPVVCRNEQLMEAFEHRNVLYGTRFPKNFRPEHISYRKEESPEELAVINYTSGTTGIFQRGHAPLSQPLVQMLHIAMRCSPLRPGRPYCIHAASWDMYLVWCTIFYTVFRRRPSVFPYPYAVSQDYCTVILRNKATGHFVCTAYRRKDYQEGYPAPDRQ